MARIVFCFVFLLLTIQGVGQLKLPKNPSQRVEPIEELPNIMIDAIEVSIGDWFAFMESRYNEGWGNDVMGFAPDPNKMPQKIRSSVELVLEQFSSGSFSEESNISTNSYQLFSVPKDETVQKHMKYPVTGISFEQVMEYLMWRADLMAEDKKVQKLGYSVEARLLGLREWDVLAIVSGPRDFDNTTVYPDSMNTHGCYLMNIRYVEPCESTLLAIEQHGEGMYPPEVFFPDKNGLYDLFGNVAEMTNQIGSAKGGSFSHWGREGTTYATVSYREPQEWLGFRAAFQFFKD